MKHLLNNITEEEMNRQIVSGLVEDELRYKYAQILKDEHNITRDKEPIAFRKVWMYAAASLAIIVFALFVMQNFLTQKSPQKSAMALLKETTILGDQSTMRKDLSKIDQSRLDAVIYFTNSNFDSAVVKYLTIIDSGKESESDLFYAAVSSMKCSTPNLKRALKLLNLIDQKSEFSEEVRWFKALALVIENQNDEAKHLLKLISEQGGYKSKEALELLNNIN